MTTNSLPSLYGDSGLSRYMSEIKAFPILTATEEFMLAKEYLDTGDKEAAHKLVTSHLRLVAKIAKQFRGLEVDSETRNLIAANIAIEQCEDLLEHGVKAFHFYTLNRAALTYAICWRLGMRPSLNGTAADAT